MKKKLIISLMVALVMVLIPASAVFANDPVVSVDIVSPGSSDVTITTTGVDDSTRHPGEVGQKNTFRAQGAFVASYDSYAGNFGSLRTYVNASSATVADFTMQDTHDFHILSANWPTNSVGVFTARAWGNGASMNLKSIGSMYCWSEATNGGTGLSGQNIVKQLNMYTDDDLTTLTATTTIQATATNQVSISNSNAWGFGSQAKPFPTGFITTNYAGGTRSITANGVGYYQQHVSAGTYASSNTAIVVDGTPVAVSANLPSGGSINTILNFINGINGTYSASGK